MMTGNYDRRLDRLSVVYAAPKVRREPFASLDALTPQEQLDLYDLLRWEEPSPHDDLTRPPTLEERRRLAELRDRAGYRP